ncbi:hypothetical protein T552_02150 [Pneumocystis carinii B80]|uniref:Mtf2-like C-terminal domain-containing protein n=1 Tax=Pneumocystis carinii (strain B80) TaxID=1408658 RepID=A0A0W4ZH52_PNEC8|nr:hypothetical protein T552_02150 [Pneumocystis carinii B80]KTW27710.1 hypothetical protein T552_02150 [Pneumocystis carinii B80]
MSLLNTFSWRVISGTFDMGLCRFMEKNWGKYEGFVRYRMNCYLNGYWSNKLSGKAILRNFVVGRGVYLGKKHLNNVLKPLVLKESQKDDFSGNKNQKNNDDMELQECFKKMEENMLNIKTDMELHKFVEESIFEPFKKQLSEGKINKKLSKSIILHLYSQLLQKAMEIFRLNFLDYVSVVTIFERIKEHGPESFVLGCSSDVYNEMLLARWEGWNDIIEIENLLTEMKINSVPRTQKTLKILKKIRSDIQNMGSQKHLLNHALFSYHHNMPCTQRLDAIYDEILLETSLKK